MIINGIEELFMALEYGQTKEITDINLNKIITDPRFFDVCFSLSKFDNVVKLSINENDFSAVEDCVERWKLLWKTVRSMHGIKILHFCDNILVSFNLEEWEDLKLSMQLMQLKEINLSNNNLGYFGDNNNLHIWKTIWEGIAACEKLTNLFLRGNNMHKISISACKTVEALARGNFKLLEKVDLFDDSEAITEEHQKMLSTISAKKIESLNTELKLSFSLLF